MAIKKITEKETTTQIKDDMHLLITQTENVNGSDTTALRRVAAKTFLQAIGMDGASKRMDALEIAVADLQYEPVTITAFSASVGTVELGQTVTAVKLTWSLNKTPAALTLDGESLDPAMGTKRLDGLSVTGNRSWTLTATDERGATASRSTSITFLNGVYYGAAARPETVDSAFLLGLTKVLSGTRARTVTVTAGEGQCIWYALPERLGACTFKVGGFEGGFDLAGTVDFTNASGYTEPYLVYVSAQSGLGTTTVEVK